MATRAMSRRDCQYPWCQVALHERSAKREKTCLPRLREAFTNDVSYPCLECIDCALQSLHFCFGNRLIVDEDVCPSLRTEEPSEHSSSSYAQLMRSYALCLQPTCHCPHISVGSRRSCCIPESKEDPLLALPSSSPSGLLFSCA